MISIEKIYSTGLFQRPSQYIIALKSQNTKKWKVYNCFSSTELSIDVSVLGNKEPWGATKFKESNEINQEIICFFIRILINTVSSDIFNTICICSLLDEEEYHSIIDEEQTQAGLR